LNIYLLALVSLFFAMSVHATDAVDPKQMLLDQVLLGEIHFRDDLLQQSLGRLVLIAPNDPQVIAAEIGLAVRQGKKEVARELLNRLKLIAPDSEYYRKASLRIYLAEPEGQLKLQEARVYALAGKINEAKTAYDALFHNDPPTIELEVEYWTLVSRIPADENTALEHLSAIYHYLSSHYVILDKQKATDWEVGLMRTLSWLSYDEGSKSLKLGKQEEAMQLFHKSFDYNNNNDWPLLGLGEIAFQKKEYQQAEAYYKRALLIDPGGNTAIFGLLSIYKNQSPEKALNYLKSLPSDKQVRYKDAVKGIQSALLEKQAEQYVLKHQWAHALHAYIGAQKEDTDNTWITYHIAKLYEQLDQRNAANEVFRRQRERLGNQPALIYAYALYLSGAEQKLRALNVLQSLPKKQWNHSMSDLASRIQKELMFEHARALRNSGDKPGANAYLLRQPQTADIQLLLGDWALEDGNNQDAYAYYQSATMLEPNNFNAQLGKIEALIALNRLVEAEQLLHRLNPEKQHRSLNEMRRVANAWNDTGAVARAGLLFQRLKKVAHVARKGAENALIFRDAARVETKLGYLEQALDDYREAMVQVGITPVYPKDNIAFTRLTRNDSTDDWEKRSIRSDAADLYLQQETRVTLEKDFWELPGTPGSAALSAEDTILQVARPLGDGRLFARADLVNISAGSFVTNNNGVYFDNFGTCDTFGCTTGINQNQSGYGAAVGWVNPHWAMDLGTTSLGFPVQNLIGGLAYSNHLNHLGWTLGVSQRLMNNSLLSYSGTTDPYTGIVWGGVVARGSSLSVSYDRGGSYGLWGYVEADQLVGKNVASNSRERLMEGVYYKIINEENRRLSVGINNMVWHYQNDLSGYSLGQGGYYSPQFYLSFALPVNYRKRTDNWSYELGGSVNWSKDTTNDSFLYPLPNLIPGLTPDQNALSVGSTGSSLGYAALALAERRLNSYFVLGALLDIQRANDFTPSHASIYIRYSVEGWQGDMDMPIRPIVPYANYRF
jgi:cellulose synthase operon protein C